MVSPRTRSAEPDANATYRPLLLMDGVPELPSGNPPPTFCETSVVVPGRLGQGGGRGPRGQERQDQAGGPGPGACAPQGRRYPE